MTSTLTCDLLTSGYCMIIGLLSLVLVAPAVFRFDYGQPDRQTDRMDRRNQMRYPTPTAIQPTWENDDILKLICGKSLVATIVVTLAKSNCVYVFSHVVGKLFEAGANAKRSKAVFG